MSVYLSDIPLEEAWEKFIETLIDEKLWDVLGEEEIPLDENALGRVLSSPIWAKISSPHYHASAMDGFAVYSSTTIGAFATSPVTIVCGENEINPGSKYVDTGDPIPDWADAVIPIENVEPLDRDNNPAENIRAPKKIRIRSAVTPWSHIRAIGEDMVATELVLPPGHKLRPVDLGAIAASGQSTILVSRKPRVAVIPTGSELVSIGKMPKPGEILEYNSIVLASQVNLWGGIAHRYPIIEDDFKIITDRILEVSGKNDLILINAGSSAGSEDYSAKVIETLGEVLVHGIAIRPGHPVILGLINQKNDLNNKIPVIGVPGFPVSSALTGEIFVERIISKWIGLSPIKYPQINASITRKITSSSGDEDYLRVVVGKVNGETIAAPLSRGSGVITSLVKADGIVIIPRGTQGLHRGENVLVRLYRPVNETEKTIMAIGSHDVLLDLLAYFLSLRNRRLVSSNVGSLAGLQALKNGESHLAGSHILEPESGEYNIQYVKKYMPGSKVSIVTLVWRQQGLYVRKGNPKSITELVHLTNSDILFVNRQRGAGTRILLDYELEKNNISPNQITGYTHEEYTHLSVAAAVKSGRVDCGMGIEAGAAALGLDFIPLFQERYDLIIPQKNIKSDLLKPLMDILNSIEFRQEVETLPGYNTREMGKIVAELN